MASFINQCLSIAINEAVEDADKNRAPLETWITTEGVNLAEHGAALVDNIITNANLPFYAKGLKQPILNSFDAQVQKAIAAGKPEVDILVELILADARAEAKKLAAA